MGVCFVEAVVNRNSNCKSLFSEGNTFDQRREFSGKKNLFSQKVFS
jgi:hypothetical protein